MEIDASAKFIYPAFLELNSTSGLPELKKEEWNPSPQLDSKKDSKFYWNESIHPEISAEDLYKYDQKPDK